MRARWVVAVVVLLLAVVVAVATRGMGLSARRAAWPGEARLARLARAWTWSTETADRERESWELVLLRRGVHREEPPSTQAERPSEAGVSDLRKRLR